MLIEIPDPEVILGVILAFLVGMGALYGYFKIRPYIKTKSDDYGANDQRLEYYERQLIDMKIRLDALEIEGLEGKTKDNVDEIKEIVDEAAQKQVVKEPEPEIKHTNKPEIKKIEKPVPEVESGDITEQVLHLITTKPMTSRDIQNTLKKSREHCSRFLKKLYEDGFVERDTSSKPYTYSITEKGKKKIGFVENTPTVA
ncbi:MAG: winged helix-turn-helix domain-containing protein [Nitrosopumilaceae archaeon]|nr:winged helix-turn-helix domain-containing protein [Nitrosopumilaceae archaeon]